jgi:hypothetical protein
MNFSTWLLLLLTLMQPRKFYPNLRPSISNAAAAS